MDMLLVYVAGVLTAPALYVAYCLISWLLYALFAKDSGCECLRCGYVAGRIREDRKIVAEVRWQWHRIKGCSQ